MPAKVKSKKAAKTKLASPAPVLSPAVHEYARRKLIVVPNQAILTALEEAVTSERSPAASAPERPRAYCSSQLLARRNEAITRFAEKILHQSAMGIDSIRSMVSDRNVMAGNAAKAPAKKYNVLESLGALIVDAEDIDRVALTSAGLGTVHDNVLVPRAVPLDVGPPTPVPQSFWHLQKVNIAAARAKKLDGSNVLVGVLDTGIDSTHPEFAGKKIFYQAFDPAGKPVPGAARDAAQHGTHVCGLICGKNSGIAPQASVAVAAVLLNPASGAPAGYFCQIAAGLNWLLTSKFRDDPGVDVLNASLGDAGFDSYLYKPLANARNGHGAAMIAAIGDDGYAGINNDASPGNYDIVLGIGAVDSDDAVAPFTDWGTVPQCGGVSKPDLCAPGVNIVSCVPGGNYASMSGTSMSAPIVTGAAALLIQQKPALSFNVQGLFERVRAVLRPFSDQTSNVRGGAGILDLTKI